jgi:hypothetical protein
MTLTRGGVGVTVGVGVDTAAPEPPPQAAISALSAKAEQVKTKNGPCAWRFIQALSTKKRRKSEAVSDLPSSVKAAHDRRMTNAWQVQNRHLAAAQAGRGKPTGIKKAFSDSLDSTTKCNK